MQALRVHAEHKVQPRKTYVMQTVGVTDDGQQLRGHQMMVLDISTDNRAELASNASPAYLAPEAA